MTIQDQPWRKVQAAEIPAICAGLVQHLPVSLHLLGILLSPTLSKGYATRDDVVRHLENSMSAGELRLSICGQSPEKGTPDGAWGLAAMTLGGGLGSAMARCHFWLSPESQVGRGPAGDAQRYQPEEPDLRLFTSAIKQFFLPNIRTAGTGGTAMFHSLNDAWRAPMRDLAGFSILRDNPCVKAAKALSLGGATALDLPEDYSLRQATSDDVPTILSSNKIVFTAEYLELRLPISAAVARKSGELASWALAHEDLSVAALHTAPNHRRRGLAPLALRRVNEETVRAITQSPINPYRAGQDVWVHGDCESSNTDAQRWFASQGFQPVVHNTWMLIKLDN